MLQKLHKTNNLTKTVTLRDLAGCLIIVCCYDTIYPENYSSVHKPVGQYHRGDRKQEKLHKARASAGIAKTIRLARPWGSIPI